MFKRDLNHMAVKVTYNNIMKPIFEATETICYALIFSKLLYVHLQFVYI